MENLVKLLPVIAVVALVVIIFLLGYVKAPPDVAYIISGIRKKPRVLIGRAGIRIPFLERVDILPHCWTSRATITNPVSCVWRPITAATGTSSQRPISSSN